MSQPYKTVITGRLVQKTAFSIGGNTPAGIVDNPLARDGLGRPTIRGTGLAGALIATASKWCSNLPATITEGVAAATAGDEDGERLHESVWRVFASHPVRPGSDMAAMNGDFYEPDTEFRAGVAISHCTGAAAENLRFDTETVPAGTQWWFCLEVDDYREAEIAAREGREPQAVALALRALADWEAGYCLLGRDVARGLGWMRLEGVQAYSLDTSHVGLWPNARKAPWEALASLPENSRMSQSEMQSVRERCVADREPRRLRGAGKLVVGTADNGAYGLDTLSIGGSDLSVYTAELPPERFARPQSETQSAWSQAFQPDNIVAWTSRVDADGTVHEEPFVPGSGVRGSLRHTLSWWQRSRHGEEVADPSTLVRGRNKGNAPDDSVAGLFGTVETGAALLISDAHLSGSDYELMLLEQHAEDEFTASTFENAKFNRMCVTRGEFDFEFLLEADDGDSLDRLRQQLTLLNALGTAHFVPLGGANWRGHGWVRLSLTPLEQEGPQ